MGVAGVCLLFKVVCVGLVCEKLDVYRMDSIEQGQKHSSPPPHTHVCIPKRGHRCMHQEQAFSWIRFSERAGSILL